MVTLAGQVATSRPSRPSIPELRDRRRDRYRDPHRAALLSPDRKRVGVHGARAGEPHAGGSNRVDAGPDHGSERPRSRDQRPHLCRQGSPRGPAVQRARGRRVAPVGPAAHRRIRDPGHDRRQPRLPVRPRPHRPGRPGADGPTDQRGAPGAARGRSGRRATAPVHRRRPVGADPRLHGPGRRATTGPPARRGLPSGRPAGQGRRRGRLRIRPEGRLRGGDGRTGRNRAANAGPVDDPRRQSRELAATHARYARAATRPEGPPVGDPRGWAQAGRRDRHESADGRSAGPREPPDVRQQQVRARHQRQGLRSARQEQEPAADQPRRQRPLPAGFDLQAGDRYGRPRRSQDQLDDARPDPSVPPARPDAVLGLESQGLGRLQHLLRLRPFERHVLLPARGDAGHRPAGALGL